VGIWPAFSCASLAALSVFSCAVFSLEWNVPGAGVPLDAAAPLDAVVFVVAALLADGASTVAPSRPPVAIEPRTIDARTAFRDVFIVITSLVVLSRFESFAKPRPGR
jgi:hypothetical protein